MSAALIHAPSIACAVWALILAATDDSLLVAMALATVAVAIVLHTREALRRHRGS